MTRILVVTNMYPPHHFGGYELSCRDVVERWRARGHDVAVLTTSMRLPGVADDSADDRSSVRRQLRFYWDDHALVTPSIRGRVAIERHNQRCLAAALDELQPDVVSIWNMGALSFGLLTTLIERRVPLVYVVCGDWLVHGVALDPWARMYADRPRLARLGRAMTGLPTTVADLGSSGAFCFISDALRAEAAAHSPWTYPISTVTYSGIDTSLFTSAGPDTTDSWRWRMLYVGRVDRRKGIETVIRALAELPRAARLDVDGRGDAGERARLEAIASELGVADRVSYGESMRSALPEIYRAADVVVFPPIWDEPFGLVPLEAMACGSPVVATGTGGSAEFLRDGENCLLFPADDHVALAAAIRRLAGDAPLRAHLVARGQRTAQDLDVDRLAGVLEAWHVAAAEEFASGTPQHRPRPAPSAA